MFCKNCGKQLADGVKFCANCGTSIDGANAPVAPAAPTAQAAPATPVAPVTPTAPAQPYVPNPLITNFVSSLTNFFKNPMATVKNATKSNTHEWTLFMAMAVVVFALSEAVIGVEAAGEFYSFFAGFGVGILKAGVAFFGVAAGIWLLFDQVFKKPISFIRVFNMIGVAAIPMVVIGLLNMLVGLIDTSVTGVFTDAAGIMSAILIYDAAKDVEEIDEKAHLLGYTIVLAIVILAMWALGHIDVSATPDMTDMYDSFDMGGFDIFG